MSDSDLRRLEREIDEARAEFAKLGPVEDFAAAVRHKTALLDKIEAATAPKGSKLSENYYDIMPGKCAPDCTPATPCYAVGVCPQYREDRVRTSEWAYRHGMGLDDEDLYSVGPGDWRYADHKSAPPPELRCEQQWMCGLARGQR